MWLLQQAANNSFDLCAEAVYCQLQLFNWPSLDKVSWNSRGYGAVITKGVTESGCINEI
jgi:hypothetical protein